MRLFDRPTEMLVTGATGFLGSRIVEQGIRRGHRVLALARDREALDVQPWAGDPAVQAIVADLADMPSHSLQMLARRVSVVVHAASSLTGDERAHARDTVLSTKRLLEAVATASPRPRFVLASSLVVYDFASLPIGSVLDEMTSLESEAERRDAYFRAKREQERLSIRAAQDDQVAVRCMRIGALTGPGRQWTSRLGWRFGPVALCPGGNAAVPIVPVADAAYAMVLAAEQPIARSDYPWLAGMAPWEAVNVIASRLPTQREFLRSIRKALGIRLVIVIPTGLVSRFVQAWSLAAEMIPRLGRFIPKVARAESFDARFKSLAFSNARLLDRLEWRDASTH